MHIDTIERIAKTGRVLLKGGGKIILSSPGDVHIKPSTKTTDALVLSNNTILEHFSKGLEIQLSHITSLIDDGNPVPIPGTLDGLIQLLSEDFFLATNPLISSNETRIGYLENQQLKVTYFEIISAATGSISAPANSTILLDQFDGVVDAIVSEIDGSNTPTWESPRDVSNNVISVSSFDTNGNYVLTSTPVGNIAIIYVYSIARLYFDYTKSIGFETLDLTAEEVEAKYNEIVEVVNQAIAEAGTSNVVYRWTPERIKQAILALGTSPYKVKVSVDDTTENYLFNKIQLNDDILPVLNDPTNDEFLTLTIYSHNKPYVTITNPNSGNDSSIQKRHRIGQIWINTVTGDAFIAKDLTIGSAVWTKIPTTEALKQNSGIATNAGFSGNPKKYDVLFLVPFTNTLYSPVVVCETINNSSYLATVENLTTTGFTINLNVNNINDLTAVRWTATKHGGN